MDGPTQPVRSGGDGLERLIALPPPRRKPWPRPDIFWPSCKEEGEEPTRLAASAVGGIGVTCRRATARCTSSSSTTASSTALFADDATLEMDTRTVQPTAEGYRDVLAVLKDYLHG